MKREGITQEIENKFYIRSEVRPTDPRMQEANRLMRELARTRKLIGVLSAAERAEAARTGLRSGGR